MASSKFPDNFGKLLQHTINAYSQWPTLPPVMLLRLLNVLRSRAHHLPDLCLGMAEDALHQAHRQFAEANCTEPVLGPELLHHLLVAVTEHFVRQRDGAYPWNGMYRRHGAYIEVLGMLLGMFAHSLLAAGMRDNRIGCGKRADGTFCLTDFLMCDAAVFFLSARQPAAHRVSHV